MEGSRPVSNFGQETVMVNPFTEVGMIAQVTAIQSVTDDETRRCGVGGELPLHLRDLVDQTSGDLDGGSETPVGRGFVGICRHLPYSGGATYWPHRRGGT